jgi:ubiquinone biosynthesis protein
MDLFGIANLGRFRHIVTTLFKYGFDDIAERLNIPGKVLISKVPAVAGELTSWQRMRLALEELGPSFVKLGQILSQRPDLLPLELSRELEKLQDAVTPVPTAEIIKVVEESLGAPLAEVFANFSETPLAAGSLAQVHQAILLGTGEAVAVKVRRPEVEKSIETDLHILETVVPYLYEHFEFARLYNLPRLFLELRRALLRELDFSREARNMKIVAGNFSGHPEVFIPRVIEAASTDRVLTMELAEGTKLKNFPESTPERRERLARSGLNIIIKQILDDGFFHADPHPGNLLIRDDDTVCLLDWGSVGVMPDQTRYELVDLISAITEKNAEKVLDVMLSFTAGRGRVIDEPLLLRDILEMIYSYHSVPIGDLNIKNLFADINTLLRTHGLQLPSDLALMFKAVVTAEGTAHKLYPGLNVIAEIRPYLSRLNQERWQPRIVMQKMGRQLRQFLRLQHELPTRLRSILERIDRGQLTIRFEHENLGGFRRTLDSASNRLAFSILTAALIIGSSMIITTGVKPLLFGYPAIGLIGYFISAIMGLLVLINIIRERNL